MTPKKILQLIKDGRYSRVLAMDLAGNVVIVYLYYNKLRHKYYLKRAKRSLHHKYITRKKALIYLAVSQQYAKRTNRSNSPRSL